MISITLEEFDNYFWEKYEIEQDQECQELAKKIENYINVKVSKVICDENELTVIIRAEAPLYLYDIGEKIGAYLKYEKIGVFDDFYTRLSMWIYAFSEVCSSWDKEPYFLPQAKKIYKAKGYEKNWEYIFNREYELNVFYKNRWKLKKAIKDGSAEALRDSILEVVAVYDKKNIFNKDNFPINFCNMRKYKMSMESRG